MRSYKRKIPWVRQDKVSRPMGIVCNFQTDESYCKWCFGVGNRSTCRLVVGVVVALGKIHGQKTVKTRFPPVSTYAYAPAGNHPTLLTTLLSY